MTDIPSTVARYLDLVANASSGAEIAALYAPDATLEDPVGTPARKGTEEIAAFYEVLTSRQRSTELLALRVAGDEAAFSFRVVSGTGAERSVIEPIDVMTFSEDGLITSMRAFWSRQDVRRGA
ncbi:steroid delta-isomerase [Nocardioides albidus]|uniref:Steroid delta-isomerase n=1 Tax=Nocardioides albidus TaxID=1517589 RepID=A0A5C4VLH0_9ACTN|nr:nuclear transport factor 2 family protein [Nocardioides albidus]TNM36386.1 steroid delta-isomerase [Nocardioides albidus]